MYLESRDFECGRVKPLEYSPFFSTKRPLSERSHSCADSPLLTQFFHPNPHSRTVNYSPPYQPTSPRYTPSRLTPEERRERRRLVGW